MKGAQNKQQKTKTALKKKGFSHSPPVWNCTQVFDCFSYIFSICVEWKKGWNFVWLLPVHLDFKVSIHLENIFRSVYRHHQSSVSVYLDFIVSFHLDYQTILFIQTSKVSLIVSVHLCQVCSSSRVFILIDMAFLNLITL